MRRDAAWLVLGISTRTLKVTGASICSEEHPTTMGSTQTVVLLSAAPAEGHEGHEHAYASAYRVLIKMLRRPEYAWVVPLLRESEREDVRRQS